MSATTDELDQIAAEALAESEASVKPKVKPSGKGKVLTFISQEQLKSDLSFSPNTLDDAMMTQPGLFAHYATQSAKAQLQCDRMKSQLELVEAMLDKEIRDQANENSQKITEALVEKTIKRDPRYQEAVSNYNEAKMVASLTRSVTDAFVQRRDMLVQIGKDLREERAGSLVQTRVENAKETAMAAMKAV